jgi:hypothetical protein
MSNCPFCQAGITEEVALYGGNCQSCLIRIPGEEAPTDPGVGQVKATQAPANRGTWIGGVAAATVIIFALGGWYLFRSPTEQSGDAIGDVAQIPLSMHEDLPFQEEAQSPEAATMEEDSSALARRAQSNRSQMPGVGKPVAEGSVIPKSLGSELSGSPLDAFSTIGSAPAARGPKGIVLQQPGQIEVMIRRVLDRGAKRLETCYNQRLKVDSNFKGAWDVSLRVTREGKAESVRVRTVRGADASTESCIKREAERWTFQRIVEPYEISRTFRFGT